MENLSSFNAAIPEIERVIGYSFRDKALLRQAFMHASFCNEERQRGNTGVQSNEVLELCGDSVLSTAILCHLMERNATRTENGLITELDEGAFSVIKSNLSNKDMLGRKLGDTGLARYLLTGKGNKNDPAAGHESVRENLFECIVGAVWFDCGMDIATVRRVVTTLLDPDSYLKEHTKPQSPSPKNEVQEWCAHHGATVENPYPRLNEWGPDHDKHYEDACRVTLADGRVLETSASAKKHTNAEKAAAALMMEKLALLGD